MLIRGSMSKPPLGSAVLAQPLELRAHERDPLLEGCHATPDALSVRRRTHSAADGED